MCFSSSRGCCEAADINIDRCQHSAIPDTTRDIDNCGWCEDLQTRTCISGGLEEVGGEQCVKEFAALHKLTVTSQSQVLSGVISWTQLVYRLIFKTVAREILSINNCSLFLCSYSTIEQWSFTFVKLLLKWKSIHPLS